jgi:peptide/nickel transport system permease protein
MWAFALRRLIILCLTLLLVSVLAFLVPYMSEGDPVRMIIRARVSELAIDESALEAMRRHLGLDRPLVVQYFSWLADAVRGDLGYSFTSRTPVAQQIGGALAVSFIIAMTALLTAFAIALPLGTLAALNQGRTFDNAATFVTQCFVAVPEYWLAPVGILVFALYLGWLPSAGWNGPSYLVLPALVLTLRPLAYFTRVTRAAMIDVLQAPYITAARSRGLGMTQTIIRHGTRNGIVPIVTLFAMWLAGLLGGSVVVEVIFAIPGMGRLIYDAVINRDIPVLQGSFVCIVALAIVINTVTDFLYAFLNPAVRITHGQS